jgi:hypothetical protein
MSGNSVKISILLPTRGRTQQLKHSVDSLLTTADDPESIEWLFGFDNDDTDTYHWFAENVIPDIESAGCTYTCLQFEPFGYERLHVYVNQLAAVAEGNWLVFWNDDAVMVDPHWDTVINSHTGEFCLQAFDTHNLHPYSIFPIVPREWFEVIGHLSDHQLNDAWLSQIAWILDIVRRIDIRVDHNRYDLTGQNNDTTFQNRRIFEGNVADPRDFNYVTKRQQRLNEAHQLAAYLAGRGCPSEHWNNIMLKKVDPWSKMLASDINGHLTKIDKK